MMWILLLVLACLCVGFGLGWLAATLRWAAEDDHVRSVAADAGLGGSLGTEASR